MKILLATGAWLTGLAFVWLMINALKTYPTRPYVPKQSQEETDKWDDWMNFV